MVAQSSPLRVELSASALAKLDEIGDWNAQTYGAEHAHEYVSFLKAETAKLSTLYFLGKRVPNRSNLHYIVIRKRRRGHGHIAVFELIGDVIYVITYYHTAQDWQNRLRQEFREK